ncbi:MAG: lytic murein transglycosylase [Pseudomonadales bacterium]
MKSLFSVRPAATGIRLGQLSVALGVALAAPISAADDGQYGNPQFAQCVAELQVTARAEGIADTVVDQVLGRVQHVDRVIQLDRQQPEFTQTFTNYYTRRVTPERVAKGRRLLVEHAGVLQRVTSEWGIPPHYLVAFWGLETNFGSFFGNIPVPDSLATLACDPRRSRFFTRELLAALRIVEAGDIQPERMVGSWAGAMGHVQFMPSNFLRFAVDADGDGKRDLWGSVPDAMASAGNFLRHSGWQPGLRWGREVSLPKDFDYTLAGRDQRRSLSEWIALGIRDAYDRPLPHLEVSAALLVPSGHAGPAFLTYDNFDVIMRWNPSEFYALTVGRLADEIAGASPLRRPPPEDALRLSRDEVRQLQVDLAALGFDTGEPDGVFGPATRRALSQFQRSQDLIADGYLDATALEAVRAAEKL